VIVVANPSVRAQHHLILSFKGNDPDVATMKAKIKVLMAYVQKRATKHNWQADINIYFSNVKKNKNHEWKVSNRGHVHLIVDSCPSNVLITLINLYWRKWFGGVKIVDLKPTLKDWLTLLAYCSGQAKGSDIRSWRRVFGDALPKLNYSPIVVPTPLVVIPTPSRKHNDHLLLKGKRITVVDNFDMLTLLINCRKLRLNDSRYSCLDPNATATQLEPHSLNTVSQPSTLLRFNTNSI